MATNYDLEVPADERTQTYNGVRITDDGQYVLIFNPEKQHFVLHRIDSTFDMNMVNAPAYPSLPPSTGTQVGNKLTGKSAPATKKALAKKVAAPRAPKAAPKRAPAPKKKAPREPTPEPDEDSDDGGLIIEDPPPLPAPVNHYTSNRVVGLRDREASEEMSDEDEDAEGEDYDEELERGDERNRDVDVLRLGSPVGKDEEALAEEGLGDYDEQMARELEAALEQDAYEGASSESEEE